MDLHPDEPAYRAPLIRVVLDIVRAMEGGHEILQRLPAGHVDAIENASPTTWLPFSLQLELMQGLYEARGVPAIVHVSQSSVLQALSNPLFGALRAGLVRPFRPSPETLMSFVPKGMALASRNMGHIEIESLAEPNTARVRWTEMHPSLRVEHVALGHQGAYYGILSWGGVFGVGVEVDLDELDEGTASYVVSWIPS